MTPGKARQLARRSAQRQKEVLEELHSLAKAITKAETLVVELKLQMEAANTEHQDRQTTAEDIAYLEALLRCARKKLSWETQMASVSKRIPEVLALVTEVMNDSANPPSEENRAVVVGLLQTVQDSMKRLEAAKES